MQLCAPIVRRSIRTVYTVRHGESEGNARGLDDESLQHQANHRFPLTERGKEEIGLTAGYILENRLISQETGIYTSGFYRAQQSMQIIVGAQENRDCKVIEDPRLDEWWKGIFHSLPKATVSESYPHEKVIQEREGWHHYRPPQGQSGKDVETNLLSFLSDVEQSEIFLVGHGRSFGFLRRILLNNPIELNCKYPIPKNGEVWRFTRAGDYFDFKSLFVPNLGG